MHLLNKIHVFTKRVNNQSYQLPTDTPELTAHPALFSSSSNVSAKYLKCVTQLLRGTTGETQASKHNVLFLHTIVVISFDNFWSLIQSVLIEFLLG